MSTAPIRRITPEEYLVLERAAGLRSEYYAGEMIAMAGASWRHNLIKDNLACELGVQFKNGPCRVVTSDLRVKVEPAGLYTYPDLVVVCDEPRFEDGVHDTLLNPRLIAEFLSDSTEKYDRGKKFRHFQRVASVREYVLIAQDEPLVDQFVRQANGSWLLTSYRDLTAAVEFASVPARVPLAEIYLGIPFDGETIIAAP